MNFNHGTVHRGTLAQITGCGTTQKVPVHATQILSSNYGIDVKGFVDKALTFFLNFHFNMSLYQKHFINYSGRNSDSYIFLWIILFIVFLQCFYVLSLNKAFYISLSPFSSIYPTVHHGYDQFASVIERKYIFSPKAHRSSIFGY